MISRIGYVAVRCVKSSVRSRRVPSCAGLFQSNNYRKKLDFRYLPHDPALNTIYSFNSSCGIQFMRFYSQDVSVRLPVKSNYIRPPLFKSIVQYLLWTPCLVLSTALGILLKPFPRLQYDTVTKLLVGSTKKIFNIEVVVEHKNKNYNNGPYLFCILNQNSLLEMIIYYAAAPSRVRLIQNIEFTIIPFFGWISALLGSVTIIRQIKERAHQGMKKVAATMRENHDNFVVSVEGRRSIDGHLSTFKKGPAIVAIESKARIIPVTLQNARDILPFGEWRINSGKVIVTLHEPIDTSNFTFADRDAVTSQMRKIAEKEHIKHYS